MLPNVLVMIVDGLRASALGSYGNTSFATPAFDRLAAESLLLDSCFAPSPDLQEVYRALWHSSDSTRSESGFSLPRCFAEAGYNTTLISDDPSLKSFVAASNFHEIEEIERRVAAAVASDRARDLSETEFAQLISSATERILEGQRDNKPRLVWLHSSGMYGNWDAPVDLQEMLLDEGDAPPIESSTPPDAVIKENDDPDTGFRYACAYAAQMMALDACTATLVDAINSNASSDWLVTVMGARGFSLGEHGRVGGVDLRTHVEQLQVPCLVRFPNGIGALSRSGTLTSHCDLLPTLLDGIGSDQKVDRSRLNGVSMASTSSNLQTPARSAVVSTSTAARSVRTASWCLREDIARDPSDALSVETAAAELYVRPDDRWEANDVAKLCPEVVDELRAIISAC